MPMTPLSLFLPNAQIQLIISLAHWERLSKERETQQESKHYQKFRKQKAFLGNLDESFVIFKIYIKSIQNYNY